jgi:hypothetical protein
MPQIYNVYCDESCHLENDGHKAMVLGAVWCPEGKRREISDRLREIKCKHGLGAKFEIKWTKVSLSKVQFYQDILDYFFDDDDLHFRGVIVPDKAQLDHLKFEQTHDDWYYKMYFTMLKTIFDPESSYRIYIDIKDTLGVRKVGKLHEVLCNNAMDFSRQMISRIQQVHSDEVEQLQLADLLIGSLSYFHRGLTTNKAKQQLIKRIQARSGYELTRTTLAREDKFNLLVWNGGS